VIKIILVLVIIGYGILIIYEFIPLYKQKFWRDFWANAVVGIFSFTIAILLCLDVKIPSPVVPIKELIISIFGK
jgi:hypothetical protein